MNEIPGVAPAIEIPGVKNVDMKLEVVVIPVSDVDRAKSFDHETLGWRLDRDLKVSVDCRALQVTPLNSQCSVAFPTGVNDAEPAQAQGTLEDIDDARTELIACGVDVSEVYHDATGVFKHGETEAPSQARTPKVIPTLPTAR